MIQMILSRGLLKFLKVLRIALSGYALPALFVTSIAAATSFAQERTPLEEFRDGFPLELSVQARAADLPTLMKGGDEAAYMNLRASEFMPTAILPVRQPAKPLEVSEIPAISKIEAETWKMGRMTLNEFIAKPESYLQGIVVVHRGKIVFERYPRMRPDDNHLWMSISKVTCSLVIDMLIAEGKIDLSEPLSAYIPEFAGTPTGDVLVLDALDMTTGLDTEPSGDPDSIHVRVFSHELGMPYVGQKSLLIDVMKEAKPIMKPGKAFQYSSHTTQLLVYLAEAVENKRWADIFEERVWSKMHAEAPLQVHLSPDGIAAAHGLVSGQLRDLARFGMLYTPSWSAAATEQVVTDAMISDIKKGVRSKEFFVGGTGAGAQKVFADDTMLSNSRQWDVVWPDGDLYKGGLMGQGLYVSPKRDLVIAYFSVNAPDEPINRFARPIATSGLFDSEKSEASENNASQKDFSVRELRNGYSASDAYRLNSEWGLDQFLSAAETGAYSYLHLPEFLPHAVIRRDGPVSVPESRPNPAIGATSLKDADGNLLSLDEMIKADDSPIQGLIVLHRGAIAYEAYPGMRRTDNHVWMSNAKFLAGLLIGQLEDEGKIDVQQTVAHYLPEARGTEWEKIKVIDVLHQQSGMVPVTPEAKAKTLNLPDLD